MTRIWRIGADYFCANARDSRHPRFALIDVDKGKTNCATNDAGYSRQHFNTQMRALTAISEDLNHGQLYGGVVVQNPFVTLQSDS
jgi:hypothetical protein